MNTFHGSLSEVSRQCKLVTIVALYTTKALSWQVPRLHKTSLVSKASCKLTHRLLINDKLYHSTHCEPVIVV